MLLRTALVFLGPSVHCGLQAAESCTAMQDLELKIITVSVFESIICMMFLNLILRQFFSNLEF